MTSLQTYLAKLAQDQFYGSVKLIIEKGQIKRVLTEQSMLFDNLNPSQAANSGVPAQTPVMAEPRRAHNVTRNEQR